MSDEKIIKLQHFFEIDIRIKKGMYNMAPSNIQYFDESTIQKYTDELNDLLIYIFCEFINNDPDFIKNTKNIEVAVILW